jgi:hypothetical protein
MLGRRLQSLHAAALLTAVGTSVLGAQRGVVRGRVTDTVGVAIAEVDVAIVAIHALTRTDAEGRFVISNVPRGAYEVSMRRIGYEPATITAVVGDLAYSYDVVLSAQATTIPGMTASADMKLRLGIEDFYRRRARGAGGTFFTRAEIARRNPRRTTDVLRNSPGLRIVSSRSGTGIRFSGKSQCPPAIWLDGQEVRDMEVDNISVTDIEGMELYSGPSTTPMQFSHGSSRADCGAIVIWTRIPGTA